MLRRVLLLGLLAAAVVLPAPAGAAVVAARFPDSTTSFTHPTYIAAPRGDTHHVYVVQQDGTIEVVTDGKAPVQFLDISSEVTDGWTAYPMDPEQGLLSIAFAPDFATSGRYFLYYTSTHCPDPPGCDDVLAEFTATDALDGNPGSEQTLITIPHPNRVNHNGGQLQFGPDGQLYVSTGDGGGANDSEQNAQKTTNLLGKILRIDPGAGSYSLPPGNPFSGSPCSSGSNGGGTCPEIWAYGLRNPWRFSFDSASGDLVIADVGQDSYEEIDYAHPGQSAGADYGWPCYEGFELNPAAPSAECSRLPSPVAPVLAYPHPEICGSASFCGEGIIGGYVIHDPSLPSLDGCYVYGDLQTKQLRFVHLAQPAAFGDADLGPAVAALSAFGEDANGRLYAAGIGGSVYRLESDGNRATTPSCPASPPGSAPPPAPAPAAPPAPPPAVDTTSPTIFVGRRRHQRILRTHAIRFAITLSERSRLTATATVQIGRAARLLRFRRITRNVPAGRRVVLKLRPSHRALRLLRRALHRRRSYLARVTVRARDTAGNPRSSHFRVRLLR